MTAETPEELFRERLAVAIGYEMACEGKKTGTQISYGVARWLRLPENQKLVLEGLGLEIKETTIYHLVPLMPRGEATDA